jgi:hypothetical protein
LTKTLYTNVVKFFALTLEHIMNFVSVCCHLLNGVHMVHPLQGSVVIGGCRCGL